MDARTQRRLRRETIRDVGYAKFLKKHTHNKNITAREERMLKRRVLREKCMKKEAEKKAEKKQKKDLVVRDMEDIIDWSDRQIHTMKKTLREIFERTKFMQSARVYDNVAEFNFHCSRIFDLCNKHLHIVTGALCERK